MCSYENELVVCSYRYTLPTVSATKCSICDNVVDMLLHVM